MSLSHVSHFNSSWKWVNHHDWRLCSGGESWKRTPRLYFGRPAGVTSSVILDLSEAPLDSPWSPQLLTILSRSRAALMWIVSSRLTLTHLIFMPSLAAAEHWPGSLIVLPDTCCRGARMAPRPLLPLYSAERRQLEGFHSIIHPLSNMKVCSNDVPGRISCSIHAGGYFVVRFGFVRHYLCGCFGFVLPHL